MNTDQRPLSPHLQIYRPQWSSVLSILHRITGLVLSAGTVLIAVWFVALASGPEPYAMVQGWLASIPALVILVGWTLAMFYHLLNGIRHLLWDTGMLLDLSSARLSGWFAVIGAVVLTIVVWGGLL